MKEIVLTQSRVTQVDDSDFDWLNQWKWSAMLTKSGIWYAVRNATIAPRKRKFTLMHRVILGLDGIEQGDHRDGDGLNNQRLNLRICTKLQNHYNRKTSENNACRFKGVRKSGNRWRSTIWVNNNPVHLGTFDSKEAAASAYDSAAQNYFGEFARLNEAIKPL